jgi:hypothetical protein
MRQLAKNEQTEFNFEQLGWVPDAVLGESSLGLSLRRYYLTLSRFSDLARRHLRTVIRERVDWHISRRNHGGHYRVYLPTVRETVREKKANHFK